LADSLAALTSSLTALISFFDLFFYSIDDFLFDLGNVLFLLLGLVADNLTKAVILSDDLVEKVANVLLHAVDLTLPDLLVRGLFLFHEHDEDVIRLPFEQVPPVHEVAKLVILQDHLDFVLVHDLLLSGQ
jgi:hypothetical protein